MARSSHAKATPGQIVIHIVLVLGAAAMLLPFIWMLSTSVKPPEEVITWPPQFIPRNPTFVFSQQYLNLNSLHRQHSTDVFIGGIRICQV